MIALLLMALGAAQMAPPAAPRITCDIRLSVWCIAVFDGTIEMRSVSGGRRWILQDRMYMDRGPLVVEETEECASSERVRDPSLTSSGFRKAKGSNLAYLKYRLNDDGCYLTLEWPRGSANDNIYRNTAINGIMIGSSDAEMWQLSSVTK